MSRWKKFITLMVCNAVYTINLEAMEFDFHPLSSLCRIEINLSTGFGSGKVRGNFEKIRGKISFSLENPGVSNGQIYLNARSLNFGHPQVSFDAQNTDWLDSKKYPEISFKLLQLSNTAWHGRELRSDAIGVLKIRDIEKQISLPLSIYYLRNERRKYQGKAGDLIRLNALLNIPRSEFGIAPNVFMETYT